MHATSKTLKRYLLFETTFDGTLGSNVNHVTPLRALPD
jgi:hypothetical protein